MESNTQTDSINNNIAGAIPSVSTSSTSSSSRSRNPGTASSKKKPAATSKKPRAKLIKSASGVERVAQACERCRAKKTRCDGKRPQCSQCLAVGLECKISDKLSRRAFPRGYTESLEDRVRELEAENRKLIAVIDLKDEQLDMMKKTESPLINKPIDSHKTIDSIVKKEVIDDSFDGTNSVGAIGKMSDVLVSKLRNNESTSDSDTGVSPISINNIEKLTDGNFNISSFNNKNALQKVQELSGASSKNQLSSTNLNILNNHNGLHEPHQEGCNCGCTSKSLLSHIVHERPTSVAASVLLGTDDERDDDDTSSLLSIENNSKRGTNFFDDYASSLGNLRSPSNNNSINNNNTAVTNGDSRRNNVISSESNNKNINAYYNNFNVSFEQKEAPGAAAAMALAASSSNNNKAHLISSLVAMSTPRTTEEILFIPPLLEKIGRVHGYDSKQAVLTAKTLFSLKMPFVSKGNSNSNIDGKKSCIKKKKGPTSSNENLMTIPETVNLKNLNFSKLSKSESHLFFTSMKFPNRVDLDQLITFYFQEWYQIIPIMDKQEFLKNYIKFSKSYENKFNDNGMYGNETFGGIMLLIISLALLGKRKTNKFENNINAQYNKNDQNDMSLLNYYDSLIKQVIVSSIVDSSTIQSLQVLTLALEYMLNIGDIGTSYILRGKVVSMAQQLRLHRCPSAVLGSSGSLVSKTQQSERRILFWCVYVLDTFSSLQLGVPRLIKDYEIECALPFANDDETDDNNTNILIINNSQLSLVGKVSNMSLAVMRYSKILGNILDSLFRRGGASNVSSLDKSCLILENLLNDWRKDLPPNLIFKLDVNGLLKNHDYSSYHHRTLALIILYYQAKILIYLPMMAIYSSRGSMSYINIQQSCGAILSITNFLAHNHNFLSLPNNCARMRSRYGLLAAKGALDYARSGNLFWSMKNRLLSLVEDLKVETKMEINGCLSNNCIRIYEETIKAILEPPSKNANNNYEEPLINSIIYGNDSISRNPVHSSFKGKNCSMGSSKRKKLDNEFESFNSKTKKEASVSHEIEDLRSTVATSSSYMNNSSNISNNKNTTRAAIIIKADTNLASNTNSIVSPSSSCSPDISNANLPAVIQNNSNNNQTLFSNSQNPLSDNLKFPSFTNLLAENHSISHNVFNKNGDNNISAPLKGNNNGVIDQSKTITDNIFPQHVFPNNTNDMFTKFNNNSSSSNEPLNSVLQTMSTADTISNSGSNISFPTQTIPSMPNSRNHNNSESINSLSSAPMAKSVSPKDQMFDIDGAQMFSDFAADGSLALAPILLGDSNSNGSSMTYNNGNNISNNGPDNTDQFNSFINGLDFDQLHEKTFSNGYNFRGMSNTNLSANNVITYDGTAKNELNGNHGLIDSSNNIPMSRDDNNSGYNHQEAMMLLMKGANTYNSTQFDGNAHINQIPPTNNNGYIANTETVGVGKPNMDSFIANSNKHSQQDNAVLADSFSKFENSFLSWPRN